MDGPIRAADVIILYPAVEPWSYMAAFSLSKGAHAQLGQIVLGCTKVKSTAGTQRV